VKGSAVKFANLVARRFCLLLSAFCFEIRPLAKRPKVGGNLIHIVSRVGYRGRLLEADHQAFPKYVAKQPQTLHFFNTAGFSPSKKFAYNG
jgi:hypothetical protein